MLQTNKIPNGTIVYKVFPPCSAYPYSCLYYKGWRTSRCDLEPCYAYVRQIRYTDTMASEIGKTIFLTEDEAIKKTAILSIIYEK